MCLLNMKIGDVLEVDSINVDTQLKQRLNAFGLRRYSHISIKHFGLFKSTVQLVINRSLIAIRKDEAKLIEVHKI